MDPRTQGDKYQPQEPEDQHVVSERGLSGVVVVEVGVWAGEIGGRGGMDEDCEDASGQQHKAESVGATQDEDGGDEGGDERNGGRHCSCECKSDV